MSIFAKFETLFFNLENKKAPFGALMFYLNIFKPMYLKSKNPKHMKTNSINVIIIFKYPCKLSKTLKTIKSTLLL